MALAYSSIPYPKDYRYYEEVKDAQRPLVQPTPPPPKIHHKAHPETILDNARRSARSLYPLGRTSLDTTSISGQTDKYVFTHKTPKKTVKLIGNTRIIENIGENGKSTVRTTVVRERKRCNHKVIAARCTHCGLMHYFPVSCHKRTCPDCAREFADKLFARLCTVFKPLDCTGKYRMRFMTFTRKTPPGIWNDQGKAREFIRETKAAWKKVYHKLIEEKGVTGAICTVEMGGRNLNLHLHVVAYCEWIDQGQLAKMWLKYTGDSVVVDIRMVKEVEAGLRELTKYVCDLSKFTPSQLEMIEQALKGTRRVSCLGIFYNCEEMKDEEKNAIPCINCGETLSLSYVGMEPMTDDIWERIMLQTKVWEISLLELENIARKSPEARWLMNEEVPAEYMKNRRISGTKSRQSRVTAAILSEGVGA